jgi:hypothetical protein
VAGYTGEAVPAMLTGRYPTVTGAPVAANHPRNLFTLLARSYDLNVHELATRMCPPRYCEPRGGDVQGGSLGRLLGEATQLYRQIASPMRVTELLGVDPLPKTAHVRQTEAFIKSLRASERPRLDYLHVQLPHYRWEYLPSGARYEPPPRLGGQVNNFGSEWLGKEPAEAGRQRHLLQLAFTDRLLGRIVDRLRQLGTYDDTLLVVTADHGVAFTAGASSRKAAAANYHEIMWVPLFMKAPGQRQARVSDAPVRSIDLLPTVADQLDLEVPWELDGSTARGRRPAAVDRVRMLAVGTIFSTTTRDVSEDDFLEFDGKEGFRRVRRHEPPPAEDDPELGLYRLEPHGALVGTGVEDHRAGPPVVFGGQLYRPHQFDDVDPAAAVVPAYVSGEVRTEGPVTLAVSVNGVIGGWSHAYLLGSGDERDDGGDGGERRLFWTMVPPSLLTDGDNDLRLHLLSERDGTVTLRPLTLED